MSSTGIGARGSGQSFWTMGTESPTRPGLLTMPMPMPSGTSTTALVATQSGPPLPTVQARRTQRVANGLGRRGLRLPPLPRRDHGLRPRRLPRSRSLRSKSSAHPMSSPTSPTAPTKPGQVGRQSSTRLTSNLFGWTMETGLPRRLLPVRTLRQKASSSTSTTNLVSTRSDSQSQTRSGRQQLTPAPGRGRVHPCFPTAQTPSTSAPRAHRGIT